jgi:acyl-CoA thioester hydrolase
MRDAYYGLMFSEAIDAFMDAIGLDAEYRDSTKSTLYVVEDHRRYLKELHMGAIVSVETALIGHDEKRLHLWQVMASEGADRATCETIGLHVSQAAETPRAAAMPAEIRDGLQKHLVVPQRPLAMSIKKGKRDA